MALSKTWRAPLTSASEARLAPTVKETIAEYNFLRGSRLSQLEGSYTQRFHVNVIPGIWPVSGRLMGGFGERTDPFLG